MKRILTYVLVLCYSWLNAQDCLNPVTLCSEIEQNANSSSFVGGSFDLDCFQADATTFFTFTTNDNTSNPSGFLPYEVDASISISNLSGIQDSLFRAVFLLPLDSSNPCAGFSVVASCDSVKHPETELNIESGGLQPNTEYYVLLGLNPAAPNFSCDFEITLSGAPLEIDACCHTSIISGQSADLIVTGATPINGSSSYVWTPNENIEDFMSGNTVVTPTQTTTYEAQAMVGDCSVIDDVEIEVDDQVFPTNMFTPNGDGNNDSWHINRIEQFPNANIVVYDSWGQEVFKSVGYRTEWDGTRDNDGTKLATGTYYYVIELNSLEVKSEPKIGFISLIR